MACPNCGHDNDPNARFCNSCGSPLGNAPEGRTTDARAAAAPAPAPARVEAGTLDARAGGPPPGSTINQTTPQPGDLLWGRYEVIGQLGRGGMGTVLRCRDTSLNDKPVAVKLLHPDQTKDPGARARLKQEVLSARDLVHPGVIRVYEYQESDDLVGFAMELLEGASVADHIEGRVAGPLQDPSSSLDRARLVAAIAGQLASAVDHIHGQGLIHRDIKPSNVVVCGTLTPAGVQAKLLDFGVVRAVEQGGLTGMMQPGTAAYMAPEVLKGDETSAASDRFSFGKTLYLMLTGVEPDYLVKPPSALIEHLPTTLDEPLMACFAPPAQRPASCAEVADALTSAVDRWNQAHQQRVAEQREAALAESRRRAQEAAAAAAKAKANESPRPPTLQATPTPAQPAATAPAPQTPTTPEAPAPASPPPTYQASSRSFEEDDDDWNPRPNRTPYYLAGAAVGLVLIIGIVAIAGSLGGGGGYVEPVRSSQPNNPPTRSTAQTLDAFKGEFDAAVNKGDVDYLRSHIEFPVELRVTSEHWEGQRSDEFSLDDFERTWDCSDPGPEKYMVPGWKVMLVEGCQGHSVLVDPEFAKRSGSWKLVGAKNSFYAP